MGGGCINILHLVPSLGGGGAERQLIMLAIDQVNAGNKVGIAVRRGGHYETLLKNSGIELLYLGDLRGLNPLLLARFYIQAIKFKPHIIQTWLPQMDIIGGLVAKLTATAWVATERASKEAYLDRTLYYCIRKLIMRFADGIVCNSRQGRSYWVSVTGINISKVHLIQNSIDFSVINNISSYEFETKFNFLVVGRLVAEKGVLDILKAIELMPRRNDCTFHFIGEGALIKDIIDFVRANKNNYLIKVHNFLPSWWALAVNSSALISMSRHEGAPNVVMEAAALGCPLILSGIDAHHDIFSNNSAVFIEVGDYQGLSNCMNAICEKKLDLYQNSKNALQISSGFTRRSALDSYGSIYNELIRA